MNIKITFHIPIKARFMKGKSGVLFYIPFKKWLFGYGGWGKQKWFRILGLTFCIGYWTIFPIEFNITIQ